MKPFISRTSLPLLLALCLTACTPSEKPNTANAGKASTNTTLENIIKGSHRAKEHKARDPFRNPAATLAFFDVQPDMTVVEIWPGGSGWYTEILAPYLKDTGTLYAAQFNQDTTVEYFKKSRDKFLAKMNSNPGLYSKVIVTEFNPRSHTEIAPAGSADRVLTFRNVHNWYMRGAGEETLLAAFNAFFTALKPGGILGIVEHRLPEGRDLSDQDASGYMKQSYVIQIAQQVGFSAPEISELNANPKDTADHPKGVWSLPPRVRGGEEDREKYVAIGESDRMTLKFVKPI